MLLTGILLIAVHSTGIVVPVVAWSTRMMTTSIPFLHVVLIVIVDDGLQQDLLILLRLRDEVIPGHHVLLLHQELSKGGYRPRDKVIDVDLLRAQGGKVRIKSTGGDRVSKNMISYHM